MRARWRSKVVVGCAVVRTSGSVLFVLGVAVTGCGPDTAVDLGGDGTPMAPESCTAATLAAFAACSTGSGAFGRWTLDERALVAYDYRLAHERSALAVYPTTETTLEGEPIERRDHWAAFGNRRVNAMLSNDGVIEVVTQDRGVEYLNKVDDSAGNHGGGFSYVDDGGSVWSSAYRYRPPGAKTSRRFGMGYGRTTTEVRELAVSRTTASPPGLAPVVISDVTLHNRSSEPRQLVHYEYWDVGRRPIEINWIVSGAAIPSAPETARQLRDSRNALFEEVVRYDSLAQRLELRRGWASTEPRTPLDEPSPIDHHPVEPFLLAAIGDVHDVYVDQAQFFGVSGPSAPRMAADAAAGAGAGGGELSRQSGLGQPHAFVMKTNLTLQPGEARRLHFVYGFTRSGQPFPTRPEWFDPTYDAAADYAEQLEPKLLRFVAAGQPELTRELAWHSYQIETSVGYRDYWQSPVVPQGSAYLYLHGADGAARDLGLFAVPLIYTDPALARLELLFYMGVQHADERFSYAFQGHGMLDDGGIHTAPSDLTLFFLWALGEYLGATGDLGFLEERAPYYPRHSRPNATVLSHLRGAVRHLFDVVGTGEHGLVRIGTGDWSDGIVVEAKDRPLAIAKGESIPNTQMAVAVLPRIADLLEARDSALASEIRAQIAGYRAALAGAHNGKFFYRAYFGDGKPAYADTINLEAQVWALIGDAAPPALEPGLLAEIASRLDDPSPIGASLLPGAQVWPAISALLTWGYAKRAPERAFAHFARNTLSAHARAFPNVWYGIWSAPDGLDSKTGLTWSSQVTPMLDFPTQNNNAHVMPLLAALRVAGIDAGAHGLVIEPPSVTPALALKSALLELELDAARLRGSYRPSGRSRRELRLVAPPGYELGQLQTNGTVLASTANAATVDFDPTVLPTLDFEVALVGGAGP